MEASVDAAVEARADSPQHATLASGDSGEHAVLRLRHVSKTFPGQRALDDVSIALTAGHVRALVGQNGSGKSTLVKTLAGVHEPDPGAEAWLDDEAFALGSASAAHAAGLRFIHQDLGLVRELDALDNLAMGRGYLSKYWISRRDQVAAARRQLEPFDLHDLDLSVPVSELAAVERAMLAIVRGLWVEKDDPPVKVLILDEPTASLAVHEVDRLFAAIRSVVASGAAVLYVSHRLDEVLSLADSLTVLRDGKVVSDRSVDGLDHRTLVSLIVGRELEHAPPAARARREDVAMSVSRLSGAVTRDVSFDVHRGEVLGIAGITGSGREEIPYLLGGARPWASGSVHLADREITSLAPRDALRAGLVLVPADRHRQSAIPELSARENLVLPRVDAIARGLWINVRKERSDARDWLERLQVRPGDPERIFAAFSGGNQQKIVLARALRLGPRVLLIDEPVQGVDVGAKAAIFAELRRLAQTGISVVVASGDAEDLAVLCDRVLVLRRGVIVSELAGGERSTSHILAETIGGELPVMHDATMDATHGG
jgi:ribose transport system ATP-binding protein